MNQPSNGKVGVLTIFHNMRKIFILDKIFVAYLLLCFYKTLSFEPGSLPGFLFWRCLVSGGGLRMHTSVGLLVLAGYLVAPSTAPERLWMSDYGMAQKKGRELHKPLAVVVGSGQNGYNRLLKEGLSAEVQSALRENYVCLYLDSTKPENQRLVKAFEISSGVGLVLSDRRGDYQAFTHDGSLSQAALMRHLWQHAGAGAVTQTVEQPITRTSNYREPTYYPQPGYSVQPYSFIPARSSGSC
jgi:hypothetical protein